MNNKLIEKIITSNNLPCPKFTFENPLLDKDVAKTLSKSLVKILKLSQQNLKVNNNLRLSILENIRKMCKTEPENHLRVTEDITALLKEAYEPKTKNLLNETADSTNKDLDAFLIRNMKDMDINSKYTSTINPEIMQALNNLNENGIHEDKKFEDIINWDCTDKKTNHILKSLWQKDNCDNDDIYVKLKSEIEKTLLEITNTILNDTFSSIEENFIKNTDLNIIVKKSSTSATCFQICIAILNYIFSHSNFNKKIQTFVQIFVENVKEKCPNKTISVLYPFHITHIVVLLDISLNELSIVQKSYVETTLEYLSKLHKESENDLIMLLSHYSQWFDIYLNFCGSKMDVT